MKQYSVSSANLSVVLSNIRKYFGRLNQSQVDGFEFLLSSRHIDGALTTQLAYMLATTWHETAFTMRPISEYGGPSYANARYDAFLGSTPARRARAKAMGNTKRGDGYKYRGRGYVQLTWQVNYAKFGRLLGVDLAGNPDLALEPETALRIMVLGMKDGLFTGKRLSSYINGSATDFLEARRVINGIDKASQIAKYARQFSSCLAPS